MTLRSIVHNALAIAWICTGAHLACGGDGTPDSPLHDDVMDGVHHACGKSTPFLCRDPETGDRVSCPTDYRPDDNDLSCDSSGCHGSYDYDPAQSWDDRAVDGDAGPSCHTCHGTFWSGTM